jgi:hypothetical protein
VAYHVEFVEPVLAYVAAVDGLTDEDRVSIVAGVSEELSRDADRFLALFPLAHESLAFRYNYPQLHGTTMYHFDLVVEATYRLRWPARRGGSHSVI